VWYEIQGDEIMMNTKRDRLKDRNLRRDPCCSICVEDEYTYVTIRGTAQLIDDPDIAQADIKHLSMLNHDWEAAERQTSDQFSKEQRVTIRLHIEHVSEYGLRK